MDGCFMCRLEQYQIFLNDGLTPAEAADLVNRRTGDQPAT